MVTLPWFAGVPIGYLSAAPRVSTRPDSEAAGPRSHVVGVIDAFQQLGADVKPYIVGDRLPRVVSTRSERVLASGRLVNLAADVGRVLLGSIHARRAWAELGSQVAWVYERAGTLQSLGWIFKKHGIPWVVETSGPFFYEAKTERKSLVLQRLARRRELWAYRTCDLIVCVTPALKDILIGVGIDDSKIFVMPNGVDAHTFDPSRVTEAARPFPGFTIGFAGTLLAWQGVDLLLDALRAVRARGLDISLAIAGDGPERESLERQTSSHGLTEHVTFLGRLSPADVPRFLASVDVGFSGQRLLEIGAMYHSPLKLYEYMAMGKPIIASAFHDASNLVERSGAGYLFRAGDQETLERALEEAYAARARLSTSASAIREFIVSHHTWTARVRTLLDAAR